MKKLALAVAIGSALALIAGCKSTPTSSNGSGQLVWQVQPGNDSMVYYGIYSLAFGGNTFVAADRNGRFFTSSDGATWALHHSPTSVPINKVIWGNNMFIAVGFNGTVLTSADGASWVQRSSDTTMALLSLVWGANKFMAYGYDSTAALTSADGISWTKVPCNLVYPYDGSEDVGWGNNRFVTVNGRGMFTSNDGLNWSIADSSSAFYSGRVVWADNQFVAAGSIIETSPDGQTWTRRAGGLSSNNYDIAWGNGKFVAYGGNMYTSSDGITWNVEEELAMQYPRCFLSYGAGKFVAVSRYGAVYTAQW